MSRIKTLFIFVDGLGLGGQDECNPLYTGDYPGLSRLMAGAKPVGMRLGEVRSTAESCVRAVDACFGVDGLPQSATGQVALLCGKPAPRILGRHVNAYPNAELRRMIAAGSLMKSVKQAGGRVTFLNGYRDLDEHGMPDGRRLSATTLVTMAAGVDFRSREQMLIGEAITHDITGEHISARGQSGVSVVSLKKAVNTAIAVADEHDLTLFECFLTDVAGHAKYPADSILRTLDGFIGGILESVDKARWSVVLCSDHGNIEDLCVASHTRNPVPLAIWGGTQSHRESAFCKVYDLAGVAPALMKWIWWC